MLIATIHKGYNFLSVLNDTKSGKDIDFIIVDNPKKQIDRLTKLAYSLMNCNKRAYIEVKYDSEYNKRPKRLDVVSIDVLKNLNIYKFSSLSKFDRDAFELNEIIEDINSKYNLLIQNATGIIILEAQKEDIDSIKSTLQQYNLNIKVENF